MTYGNAHDLTEGDDTFDFSGGGVLGVGEEAWREELLLIEMVS